MKKLLSIAAVAALLVTGLNAADNEIEVTGEVQAGAVVSLGAAPTTALVGDVFLFEGATIDLGKMALAGDTTVSTPLHVKTNSDDGVKMTLSDATNSGNLADGTKTPIVMKYALAEMGDLTLGTAQSIATETNDGATKVDDLVATASVPADQESGLYGTTLTVLIEAN